MFKRYKKILSIIMATMLLVTGCSADNSEKSSKEKAQEESEITQQENTNKETSDENTSKEEDKKEPIVIRYGSHAAAEEDPNYKDPVTDTYTMDEELRERNLKVIKNIEETLNVKFEIVQYPGDTSEVLLQSILAGDPVCDMARIYTYGAGTILGQNILQPLGEWEELLGEEDPPKVAGDYYFTRIGGDGGITFLPLVYNIDYIEAVETLKVDGETVYPTDLYLSGDWTWSTFKDYLSKIDQHYENSQAPVRAERRIEAFWSSHYDIVLQAIHAAGGSIYGREGLAIDSKETIEGVMFTDELINTGLVYVENDYASIQDVTAGRDAIGRGETVFALTQDWKTSAHAKSLASRNESLGYVPFPRPDHMDLDDSNYRDCRIPGESFGILKGVDEEKIPLVIEAGYMWLTKDTGEVEEVVEGTVNLAIDTFHPEIGADMVQIYLDRADQTRVNEMADIFSITGDFLSLVENSIYGRENTPAYPVAVESHGNIFEEKVRAVEETLASAEPKDNVAPKIKQVETKPQAYAIGTDFSSVDFSNQFEAIDNIDGILDMTQATIEIVDVDVNMPKDYPGALVITIDDNSGNTGKLTMPITIYDPDNTEKPIVKIKEKYRTVKVDEDTSKINWAKDFVASAVDVDGVGLKNRITADLSELDTTTPGTYNVALTVSDYVDNQTTLTIEVTVE